MEALASRSRRVQPYVISAALHAGFVWLLVHLPGAGVLDRRPLPDLTVERMKLEDRKIIWYKFEKEKPTPEIAPKLEKSETVATGREASADTVVALPPRVEPGLQTILQPQPKPEVIQPEIEAPNLILLQTAPLPTLPTPPPPVLVPPEAKPVERASLPVRPTPAPPVEQALEADPAPEIASLAVQGPPSPESPINLAIIGARPTELSEIALPPGARAARFAKAPVVGEPSVGGGGEGAVILPGIRVTEAPPQPKEPVAPKPVPRKVLVEVPMPSYASTFAAPLRPLVRSLPGVVEERFARRNVYTLIVPKPSMPMYTGDWVIWFAEMQEAAGETVRMRPPVLFRKHTVVGASDPAAGPVAEGSVRLSAVIRKEGDITEIALAGGEPGELAEAAAKDLAQWEFRAANRNGVPVDVEVIIQIPMRVAP